MNVHNTAMPPLLPPPPKSPSILPHPLFNPTVSHMPYFQHVCLSTDSRLVNRIKQNNSQAILRENGRKEMSELQKIKKGTNMHTTEN